MITCKCHMFKFNQWIIGTYYKLPIGYQNQGNFPWFSCLIEQLLKRPWMYNWTLDLMYNSRLRFFMNQILELTDFCVKCPYFCFSLKHFPWFTRTVFHQPSAFLILSNMHLAFLSLISSKEDHMSPGWGIGNWKL